jgi:DNA polymerase I-like protein with 3'-5' exonuclease and polymerase domains
VVVALESIDAILNNLSSVISLDTETTGLNPYKDSELFSIILADERGEYYFNFNKHMDCFGKLSDHCLPRSIIKDKIIPTIEKASLLFLANAKFDMAIVEKEGVVNWPPIHDDIVAHRLLNNDLPKVSLEIAATHYGYKKSEAVEEFIEKHKLYEIIQNPARKKKEKNKFFYKVPMDIIVPYALTDARITFDIGLKQRAQFKDFFTVYDRFKTDNVDPYVMESELIKVLYKMEKRGIYVNREECFKRAANHQRNYELESRKFHDQTRSTLIDSAKVLSPVFARAGFTAPKTEKENDSISDAWLESVKHPLADLVRNYRHNYKLANTFYKNYIWHIDQNSVLHANINQSGTRTGRMSYSNPNLQQIPASPVRQILVPPQGYCCVSIDWDQQEYRMMLDYAEEMELIDEVKRGLDVHTATANLTGVTRKEAKTLNFLLLYGGGVVKLCLELFPVTASEPELWYIWKTYNDWQMSDAEKNFKVSEELFKINLDFLLKASALRKQYFSKLPKVEEFIGLCKRTALARGYINSWSGRRLNFKPEFCYKAPNALIQGGAADVAKYAMINIDKTLTNKLSYMVAQIHDEFWFYIHETELSITKDLVHIMENTFPHKHLSLTSSVEYSWENFYDLKKLEQGQLIEKTRDKV